MASDPKEIKQLILKFKLNLEDLRNSVKEVQASMKALDVEEKKRLDAGKKTQEEINREAQQLLQAQTRVTEALNQQVEAEKRLLEVEKQVNQLTAEQLRNAQTATLNAERQAEALKQKAAAEREAAAAAQTAAQAKGITPGAAVAPAAPGFAAGAIPELGGGAAGGVFAGAIGGLVALAGEHIISGLTRAAGAIAHIARSTVELVTHVGPLQQVTEQFMRLSGQRGEHPSDRLNELSNATKNLVDQMSLMRMANAVMTSGLTVTNEQLETLLKNTVNVARAQGRDATYAVEALSRSFLTGRFNSLGFALGIRQAELRVRGLSEAIPESERQLREFQHMFKVIAEQAEEVGPPTTTITERLTQLRLAVQNMGEDFALSLVRSRGFTDNFLTPFGRLVDWLSQKLPALGVAIGRGLGDALEIVLSTLKPVTELFSIFGDRVKALYVDAVKLAEVAKSDIMDALTAIFGEKMAKQIADTARGMFTLKTLFVGIAEIAVTVAAAFRSLDTIASAFFSMLSDFASGRGINFNERMKKLRDDLEKIANDLLDQYQKLEDIRTGKSEGFAAGGRKAGATEYDERTQQRIAKARVELERATVQQQLELRRQGLAEEELALNQSFSRGLLAHREYLERLRSIRERQRDVELDSAKSESEAKLKLLDEEKKRGITSEEYTARAATIRTELATRIYGIESNLQKQLSDLGDRAYQDEKRASLLRAEAEAQAAQITLSYQEKAADAAFKKGEITAAELVDRKKAIWAQELAAYEALEKKKFEASEKTYSALEQYEKGIAARRQQNVERQRALEEQQPQLSFDELMRKFQSQAGVLTAQRQAAKVGGLAQVFFPLGAQSEAESIKQIISLYEQWIDALKRLGATSDATLKEKILQEILKLVAGIKTLQREMPTALGAWATGLGQISASLGQSAAGRGLRTGAVGLGALDLFSRNAEALGVNRNPFIALGKTFKELVTGGKDFSKNLQGFTAALSTAITSVTGFVQALSGQGGPLQAGLAGLSGGAGLGQSLGGAIGSLAGLGAKAGPWGAVIGAGIGLVAGIFGGKAKKQAEKIAKSITEQFNKVLESYNLGNTKLKDAIAETERLRQDAISRLSSKKGGREQLDKILPEFDRTINQLRSQQAQIFKQFEENLKILQAPDAYQDALRSVDSIIKKYQEYIDAGGSVARANEFLTISFRQLKAQGLDQLNDAEMEAIENALSYNDLLKQRQDLITETQKQIEDILFAGVPTRQRTRAQTIGEQVAKLEQERNRQLEQLDKQIRLAEYRMNAEREIFGLATERISLETRLVQLKFIEIDRDMERIRALQSVVSAYGGTFATLDALLVALGLRAAPAAGSSAVERMSLADLYELRGRQGLGLFGATI